MTATKKPSFGAYPPAKDSAPQSVNRGDTPMSNLTPEQRRWRISAAPDTPAAPKSHSWRDDPGAVRLLVGAALVGAVLLVAIMLGGHSQPYGLNLGSDVKLTPRVPIYRNQADVVDAVNWVMDPHTPLPANNVDSGIAIEEHDIALGAVLVERETRVAILAHGTTTGPCGILSYCIPVPVQIRVLDGERTGYIGWVSGCWLNPLVWCGKGTAEP